MIEDDFDKDDFEVQFTPEFSTLNTEDIPMDSEEDEELKTLFVTRNEALYIDDQLTLLLDTVTSDGITLINTLRPIASTGGICGSTDLIERVGLAVLWVLDPDNEGTEAMIKVTQSDLFALREIANSFVKVNDEPVGLNLKRKIYQLMMPESYNSDKVSAQLLNTLPEDLFKEPLNKSKETPVKGEE